MLLHFIYGIGDVNSAGRFCAGTRSECLNGTPSERERHLHFSVARERDVKISAGRVCGGTVFHIFHGTTG